MAQVESCGLWGSGGCRRHANFGGMMKKYLLASLAIVGILAIAPSSQADSFSYSVGVSNFAVNPNDGSMILASNNGTLIPLGPEWA